MGENAVSTKSNPPRRKFLAGAALGTGVAAGFPMIARAQQPITLRWQSTWPAKDIFHEYALDYAKKVNEMSGGRLRIDVLPAGAVVRAFDLIDAVAKGTLDGGHGVSAYWYGKNSAFSLFGTGPAVGMKQRTGRQQVPRIVHAQSQQVGVDPHIHPAKQALRRRHKLTTVRKRQLHTAAAGGIEQL